MKVEPMEQVSLKLLFSVSFSEARFVALALRPSGFIGLDHFLAGVFPSVDAGQIADHGLSFKSVERSRCTSHCLKYMTSAKDAHG